MRGAIGAIDFLAQTDFAVPLNTWLQKPASVTITRNHFFFFTPLLRGLHINGQMKI